MINKLRRRFIFIAMGSLLMVLIAIFLLINWTTSVMATHTIMDRLRKIDEYASSLVEGVSPNGLNRHEMSQNRLARDGVPLRPIALQDFHYEARYFIVQIRTNGSKKYIDLSHITQVGPREAKQFTRIALRRRSNLGKIETVNGTYLYLKQVEDGRVKHITFLDTTREREIIDTMLAMTILIGVFIYIAVFLLVTVLSKRAIYPFIENYEKQKSFITNAGHELKTPIAIISANAEVLEMMSGENEWTQSILHQSKRMTKLVNNLVRLARMEEKMDKNRMEVLSLSEISEDIAHSFEAVIQQGGKKLEKFIEKDIKVKSDINMLQELISILIDNASKYCDDGGTIGISLSRKGRQAVFSVSNDYSDGKGVDYSKFFDRFYREDSSHNSSKGGFGIGLSMAAELASSLGIRINTAWAEGRISFTLHFAVA